MNTNAKQPGAARTSIQRFVRLLAGTGVQHNDGGRSYELAGSRAYLGSAGTSASDCARHQVTHSATKRPARTSKASTDLASTSRSTPTRKRDVFLT